MDAVTVDIDHRIDRAVIDTYTALGILLSLAEDNGRYELAGGILDALGCLRPYVKGGE